MQAGRRLVALCEAVLDHHAETAPRSFVTDRLPDPSGALVVGCALQLADDDGARAWWQYAAAADEGLSPYRLHLQHQKYREGKVAGWWLARCEVDRWTMRGKLAQGPWHGFGSVTFAGHLLLLAAAFRLHAEPEDGHVITTGENRPVMPVVRRVRSAAPLGVGVDVGIGVGEVGASE